MVTDRDSLVDYIKTVDEHITDEAKKIKDRLPPGLSQGQQVGGILAELTRLRPCWREEGGPWKSEEIYFYLVRYSPKQFGIFNGLNAGLENVSLRSLYDGCVDIGQTVRDMLDQEGVDDAFLEYYWSDPRRNDDLVVDDSGNPIRGLSPGTSVKLGYFLETDFGGVFPSNHVLGSGIHPDQEYYVPEGGMCQDIPDDLSEFARGYLGEFPDFMELQKDDDGECAIASSEEVNLKVAGFNLLLMAAVMFFGAFGKKRLGGKLRTWKF